MPWAGSAASLVSTAADLNRFYAMLLAGEIVAPSSLAEMRRTVPVISQEGRTIDYGLGLHPLESLSPGQDPCWGHGGTVWGGGTPAMARADGGRQWCVAVNLQRWNELGPSGRPAPHAIDAALVAFHRLAANGRPGV